MTDSVPRTSAPPDLIDVGMDEPIPDEILPATAAACDTVIQTRLIPSLGTSGLVQTLPPALLFVDKDERPDWLMISINEYLQYVPYYTCLGKVVDLFLTQEAWLGYPVKVTKYIFSRFTH